MLKGDCAEALKAEFDMEIQSEEFGFNCTLLIEVSTCQYRNKYHNCVSNQGKVKVYFHSHFLDDSAQNVDTKFEKMKRFIHCMYQIKLLIIDGIINDTDGCSKQ